MLCEIMLGTRINPSALTAGGSSEAKAFAQSNPNVEDPSSSEEEEEEEDTDSATNETSSDSSSSEEEEEEQDVNAKDSHTQKKNKKKTPNEELTQLIARMETKLELCLQDLNTFKVKHGITA